MARPPSCFLPHKSLRPGARERGPGGGGACAPTKVRAHHASIHLHCPLEPFLHDRDGRRRTARMGLESEAGKAHARKQPLVFRQLQPHSEPHA